MRGLLLLALLAGAAPVRAADALGEARAWYQKGRCKEALRLLATAERDPALGEDARVDVYVLQAACSVALQQPAGRDDALDKLVRLRPLHELDAMVASPDVRAALEERRAAWRAREGVTVLQVALEPPVVRVVLEGTLARAQRVDVYVRPAGTVALQRLSADVKGNEARLTVADTGLWDAAARAGALELVAEVRDAANIPVARQGDAVHPMSTPVTAAMLEPMRAPAPAAAVMAAPAETPGAPPGASGRVAPAPSTEDADPTGHGEGADADGGPHTPAKRVNVPKALVSAGLLLGLPMAVGVGSLLGSVGLFLLSSFLLLATSFVELWGLTGGASSLLCCVSGCGLVGTVVGGVIFGVLGLLGFFVDVEGPMRTTAGGAGDTLEDRAPGAAGR